MSITLRREAVESFLTYEDIWTKVQSLVDDDDSDVLVVIKAVINLVYNEIISKFRDTRHPPQWMLDYDDTLTTTASSRSTSLNTADKDIERILKVSIKQNDAWYPCLPILASELEEDPDLWWNTTRTERPSRYFHKKSYNLAGGEDDSLLWFWMPDDAYEFRYWFEKRLSNLESASDVPQIPAFAHNALVYGTLVQLAMFDIRIKVGPWAELYAMVMNRLSAFSNNFVLESAGVQPWGL